jgi:solute carrier family 45 protein 1/2/4
MSLWKMMALTVSMGGSQVSDPIDGASLLPDFSDRVDSVSGYPQPRDGSPLKTRRELGYGTPYLLSLGLSEQLTSLVWLAGPISGLIAQPLIGAISDSSNSRYRRRYWIVTATVLLVFSGLGLAFTEPVARALVDLFGGGQGDWDPRHAELASPSAFDSR